MNNDLMEIDILMEDLDDKCKKTYNGFINELQAIKAGRANPHILDKIAVDYYGTMTPINQMANISIAEARVLVISVWDVSAMKNVEKAILAANIGITPSSDGKVIRLVFPELTEEKRKSLVKETKAVAENMKITIRNHRRDANDEVKKLKKDNMITEDDVKELEKDIDKKVNGYIEQIEALFKDKEKEIMSV